MDKSKGFPLITFLIPLIIFLLFFLIKSSDLVHSDFAYNYFGGKLLINGWLEKEVYQPYYFNSKIQNNWKITLFSNYSLNSPFISIFLVPFSFLDYFTAKLLFNVFSIFLFCITLFRTCKFFKVERRYLLLIPFVFF